MRALLASLLLIGCGGRPHDRTLDQLFAEGGGGMCGCGAAPEPGTLAVQAPSAARVTLDGHPAAAGIHVLTEGAHRLAAELPDHPPSTLELDAHPSCRLQVTLNPDGSWQQTLTCEDTEALLRVVAAPVFSSLPTDAAAAGAWAADARARTERFLGSFRLALAAAIQTRDIILVSLWRDLEVQLKAASEHAAATPADPAQLRVAYQRVTELAGRLGQIAIDCWCPDWSRGAPLPRAQLLIVARAEAVAPLQIVSATLRVDGQIVRAQGRQSCGLATQAMGYLSRARHLVDVELSLASDCSGAGRTLRVTRELDAGHAGFITARVVRRGEAIDLHVVTQP